MFLFYNNGEKNIFILCPQQACQLVDIVIMLNIASFEKQAETKIFQISLRTIDFLIGRKTSPFLVLTEQQNFKDRLWSEFLSILN
jgi:hypothetical protein